MLWSTGAVLLSVCSTLFWTRPVSSHGLLADPPSRSSMWRLGYQTPVNYQDNELFCGGFAHQVDQGYKCGVCGDPYDGVRDNEEGGKYATGIITRTYRQGQTATFRVNITANHKGYFEFKLCPTNSATVRTTQACLDLHPVLMADGSGTKYQLTHGVAKTFDVQVQLPQDLNCKLCVLQWRYHTGNSWGIDADGTGCIGCGYQEEFYGCADVRILVPGSTETFNDEIYLSTPRVDNSQPVTEKETPTAQLPTAQLPTAQLPTAQLTTAYIGTQQGCWSYGVYQTVPGMDAWCLLNCAAGYCPSTHCVCG